MTFYRLAQYADAGVSFGYAFFASKHAAEKAQRAWLRDNPQEEYCEIMEVEVTPSKAGILATLNRFASHPDNG